ncbi:MAG: tagaturonate epimerase family protein [Planctomycetota bacterium]
MSDMLKLLEAKNTAEIATRLAKATGGTVRVYPASIILAQGTGLAAVKVNGTRMVMAVPAAPAFKGTVYGDCLLAPWNAANAAALAALLPWTRPTACGRERSSFGTGDRLGVAGPAHVRALRAAGVFPVLAQQSMRELTQTDRSYREVVDAAGWAVFQEGYRDGFGADGDHLKKLEDIRTAVETGMRMITLDLSDKLRREAFDMDKEDLEACFEDQFDDDERETLLSEYEHKDFTLEVGGRKERLKFLRKDVLRNVICYYRGVEYAAEVYAYLEGAVAGKVDFEISIDEVGFPTTPKSHLFVACELEKRQIGVTSLAPCFVGEFQKAVDYRGDIAEFRRQLEFHCAIARAYGGYKVSIHSGSDKFAVYPAIGAVTRGLYHVKTAGTSWVEAMKAIALTRPALYREVHACALASFAEAAKLYHVTTDLNRIPALDTVADKDLAGLFNMDDARQLIHITYGFILRAKNADGTLRFRDRLYQAWDEEEDTHHKLVAEHIGQHLKLLKV